MSDFRANPDFKKYLNKNYSVMEWLGIIAALSNDKDPSEQKKVIGRPTKYSYKLAVELCCSLIESGTMMPVIEKAKLCRTTIWRWHNKYPSFRDMYRLAEYIADKKKVLQHKKAIIFSPAASETRGRKSLYRLAYCEKIGPSYSMTAKSIGVSRRTVINWSKKYPEFGMCQIRKSYESQLPHIKNKIHKLESQMPLLK